DALAQLQQWLVKSNVCGSLERRACVRLCSNDGVGQGRQRAAVAEVPCKSADVRTQSHDTSHVSWGYAQLALGQVQEFLESEALLELALELFRIHRRYCFLT